MAIAKKINNRSDAKTTRPKLHRYVEDQPLEVLSADEFEAITHANYEHAESRIILRLFLNVNYVWHVSRYMQGLPSAVTAVDWKQMELNSAQRIRQYIAEIAAACSNNGLRWANPDKYKKV